MHLMNLTPLDIVIVKLNQSTGEYDEVLRIQKSPMPACIKTSESMIGNAGGVDVYRTIFGEVENVPKPNGIGFIVSRMVAERLPNRHDLLIPHKIVQDKNDKIIGYRAFTRI